MHKTKAGSLLLLTSWVCAGCAGLSWAGQAAPQPAAKKPAPAAVKKAPATHPAAKAKPATAPAKQAVAPVKKAPAPPRVTQRAQAGPRRAAKPAPETKAVQAPKKEQKAAPPVTGRRDPFKVPVVMAGAGGEAGAAGELGGALPPGPRGLVISQLQLEGIVRLDSSNTMIAVVTNFRKLAYFLKENDPVYNGVVSKITPDSVYFKENHLDPNGRVTTVDVVKRLSPAPGEGK